MLRTACIFFVILMLTYTVALSQVEHVQIVHPVYNFLLRFESKGWLENFSLSSLPLQRKEIAEALGTIRHHSAQMSEMELSSLNIFEKEFGLKQDESAVVIFSETDSIKVISEEFFGNKNKFIYRYQDSLNSIYLIPLGSAIFAYKSAEDQDNRHVLYGNLGLRLRGTLGKRLGYYLQATNGSVVNGDKTLAMEDPKLRRNIKFVDLNSDFDFTESHIRFDYDWFYASIGRESRLIGSGLHQKLIISDNSPAIDALTLGVRFKDFEYRYMHGSLLSFASDSNINVGASYYAPDKFMVYHRFSLRPSWGEISFWENVYYSDRNIDIAYLNPLSFFKSLEHALRDRDNSVMGFDAVFRPINNLQLKGTFVLDDIMFSQIGKGFWSNKTAWNLALLASLPFGLDAGIEYSRLEPYVFSHFNKQNSVTNDSLIIGSYLEPNSELWIMKLQWWWGGRYPIGFDVSYARHGDNIYDEAGNLIRNVGGSVYHVRRHEDSPTVTFLDGDLNESTSFSIYAAFEIIRGFSLHFNANHTILNGQNASAFQLIFRFEDF